MSNLTPEVVSSGDESSGSSETKAAPKDQGRSEDPSVQQASSHLNSAASHAPFEDVDNSDKSRITPSDSQNTVTQKRVEDALLVWNETMGDLGVLRPFAERHRRVYPEGLILESLATFRLALPPPKEGTIRAPTETLSPPQQGRPMRDRLRLTDIMHDICELHVRGVTSQYATHQHWSRAFEQGFLDDFRTYCAQLAAAKFGQTESRDGKEDSNGADDGKADAILSSPADFPRSITVAGDPHRSRFVMNAAPVTITGGEEETKKESWEFVHSALLEYFFAWHNVMLQDPYSETTSSTAPLKSLRSVHIERLGAVRFAHMSRLLQMHAELVADIPDLQQIYVSIVLESQTRSDDPDHDKRLVTAASNAISILNHGATQGVLPFRFATQRDWSGIRVPYANLSNAQILHCKFDGADLSFATIAHAYLKGSSFVGANLQGVRQPLVARLVFPDNIQYVCFSADGTSLAVAARHAVLIYDAQTFKLVQTLKGQRDVRVMVFCPDGARLVSGAYDGCIRYYNLNTGSCLRTMQGHNGQVNCLALHPNGLNVASASDDRTVRIWDITTGRCVAHLQDHRDAVAVVWYSPDGGSLISSTVDGSLRLWDTQDYKCSQMYDTEEVSMRAKAISPNSSLLAARYDLEIAFWSTESGRLIKRISGLHTIVANLAFSPDGKLLAAGLHDGLIQLWSIESTKCLARFRGHAIYTASLNWSPNGQRIVSSAWDFKVLVWDASYREPEGKPLGHTHAITSICFTPDGQKLITGSEDSTLRVWDMHTSHCTMTLKGHGQQVNQVSCSPDGSVIASASWDTTVRLWSTATGECLKVMRRHNSFILALAFAPRPPPGSPAAVNLLASADQNLWIWEGNQQETVFRFRENVFSAEKTVDGVAWSWTAQYLAICGKEAIHLWDLKANRTSQLRGHTADVTCISFSPVKNLLASGGFDSQIRVWDVEAQSCKCVFDRHVNRIKGLAWSPNGAYLASASRDQTIRIWNVETAQCVTILDHPTISGGLAWSPDGNLIVSGGSDACTYVWKIVSSPPLTREASSKHTRPDEEAKETKESERDKESAGIRHDEDFIVELHSILGWAFLPNFDANWENAIMDSNFARLVKGREGQEDKKSKCSIV